jgi:peptidoglycan/LPS O-acetylase OafA/YrhL
MNPLPSEKIRMFAVVSPKADHARVYFPALDGLRFLAFLMVLVGHSKPLSGVLYPGTIIDIIATRISMFGWTGVEVFLVLSSYLIVTLLLKESDRTGSIGIGRFYMRRALRIWPLYYPYLLFAIFIYLPLQGTPIKTIVAHQLFPFSVFLGNYSYWYFSNYLSYAFAHLWTVCMEEQFYLALPILIYFGRRWSFATITGVLVGAELLSIACRAYGFVNDVYTPSCGP